MQSAFEHRIVVIDPGEAPSEAETLEDGSVVPRSPGRPAKVTTLGELRRTSIASDTLYPVVLDFGAECRHPGALGSDDPGDPGKAARIAYLSELNSRQYFECTREAGRASSNSIALEGVRRSTVKLGSRSLSYTDLMGEKVFEVFSRAQDLQILTEAWGWIHMIDEEAVSRVRELRGM